MAAQHGGLQQQRRLAGQAPGLGFVGPALHGVQHALERAVEGRVGAARGGAFVRHGRGHVVPAQRAQQVQRHDVARALPDRVQRHLAVDAGHHALALLLDVAVAAQALHRLLGEQAAALADPELGHRRQQAAHHRLVRQVGAGARGAAVLGGVHRRGQAQGQGRGGLALQRHVGQHVEHQRVLHQTPPEGAPLRRVVQRERQRVPHQAGGAERAVQPRQRPHGQDLRHAAPLLADEPGERAVELHLRAGVGVVAELVLQSLDRDRVDRAVGAPARQEQAAQTLRRLRQHQEGVAHRRREEPLVACEAEAPPPGVLAVGLGARGVRANVRAALLLGHAHAHRQGGLGRRRGEARVVGRGGQPRAEGGLQRRVGAQRGRHRVAHRDRAQHRGLELGGEHETRGALQVPARPLAPGRAVQPRLAGVRHQRVVAGVELHLVHAPAEAVVRAQHRPVQVGQARLLLQRRAAGAAPDRAHPLLVEARVVPGQRVAQRGVRRPQVHVLVGRGLVGDGVRGGHDG